MVDYNSIQQRQLFGITAQVFSNLPSCKFEKFKIISFVMNLYLDAIYVVSMRFISNHDNKSRW